MHACTHIHTPHYTHTYTLHTHTHYTHIHTTHTDILHICTLRETTVPSLSAGSPKQLSNLLIKKQWAINVSMLKKIHKTTRKSCSTGTHFDQTYTTQFPKNKYFFFVGGCVRKVKKHL